jgi:hypothetical protein
MLFSKGFKVSVFAGCFGVALLTAGVAVTVAPSKIEAQVTTASLSGTVTDPSGAVIAKAAIVLTSTKTGATRTTITNKSGDFSFSAVASGDYTVTVTAKGFDTFSETGLHLDPQDERVLRELRMTVGSSTEIVTVDATDAGINTDSGEISSLISAEDIKHLAIEGRDVTELLKIIPGFTPVSTGVGNSVADPSQVGVSGSVGQYSGNGTPLYGVALLFDGADITDPGNFGATIQTVNYDQVSEVKVQTASMTADTAHGPIIVNALGAYGGSDFHGSLYTYSRVGTLNSTDWYAKHTNQPKPNDRQVYPGFTFGGPVVIPFTHFNEIKKLNFWVGAEDYAQRNVYAYGGATAATLTALVPTAAMRTGDFSPTQISQYCPGSAVFNNICSVPVRGADGSTLTNGNISAFLDPGALAIFNAMPLPTPGLVPSAATPYNWITTNLTNNDLWQMRGRLDYALRSRTKIFAVYSGEKGVSTAPQLQYYSPRGSLGGINYGGGLVTGVHTQLGALNVSTIISNSLTNEFYASASYFKSNTTNKNNKDTLTGSGYPYNGAYRNGSQVLPQLSDYSYNGLPVALFQDQGPQANLRITKFIKTAGDNVSYQLRSHTLRAGAYGQLDINNQPGQGVVNTNGSIDAYYFGTSSVVNGQTIYNTGATGGGNYLANLFEGHIADYNQTNVASGSNLYFWNLSGYVQDHWRIFSHLSVDYGVRFEHITPWSDSHGIGIPIWDPNAYSNDTSGSPLPGFLWHSINQTIPMAGFQTRLAYIEPRAGFSWDPLKSGNTIVRGGFGIYRAHDSYNDASAGQANAQGVRTFSLQNTTLAAVSAANVPITTGAISFSSIHGVAKGDDEMPQVKTWDFAVVQRLPYKSQIQVAYVGSYSNNMLDDGGNQNVNLDDVNALPIGAFYSTGQYTIANYAQVSSLTVPQQNAFRKYPLYKNVLVARHRLYSNYNGLQSSFIKQAGPIRLNVNYTFSKALGVLGAYQNGHPTDPFNLRNNYLPEGFDRTHVFNASYTYDVGTTFHEKIASMVLNHWEISGITNYISGQSMQAQSPNFGLQGTIIGAPNSLSGVAGTNYSLSLKNNVFLGTPDVSLQPRVTCNPTASGNHRYFNSSCFALPTQLGVNGTYRFPYIHGPSFFNTDLSLTRNFPLRHKQNINFRFAAFNFINHANSSFNTNLPAEYQLNYSYTDTTGTITDPTSPSVLASIPNANASQFGTSTLKAGRRVVALSFKYTF